MIPGKRLYTALSAGREALKAFQLVVPLGAKSVGARMKMTALGQMVSPAYHLTTITHP